MEYLFNENIILLKGVLDKNLKNIFLDKKYDKTKLYFIDMYDVYNITFNAIHVFIDMYNSEYKFMLVRCKDDMLLYLHDTGLSNYINIMGDFKNIDINDFECFGGGYCGKSYKSNDGLKMLKIYDINFEGAKIESYKEKAASISLIRMNIPSPLSSYLVKTKDGYGIIYEYLKNKISYSKLIAQDCNDEKKLKNHAAHIAKLIKKVHSTECDTKVFLSAKTLYKNIIETIPDLSEKMRINFNNDLSQAEDGTTCLHGDFQIGNVVLSENKDILIDLPEFSYGSPYFDLGSFYAVCHSINVDFVKEYYHNDVETLKKIWYYFVREYFNTEDENIIQKEEKKILLYARLRIARFMQTESDNDLYRAFYNSLH